MRSAAVVGLAALLAGAEIPSPGVLRAVRSSRVEDTLRLALEFAGRPERLRVANRVGPNGRPGLRIDLQGARMDSLAARAWPSWFVPVRGADTLAFQIELDKPASWRGRWRGDVLQVDVLGGLRQRSFWTSPLGVVSAGAGLAAGGLAVWVLSSGGTKAGGGGASDSGIPAPGFGFPK